MDIICYLFPVTRFVRPQIIEPPSCARHQPLDVNSRRNGLPGLDFYLRWIIHTSHAKRTHSSACASAPADYHRYSDKSKRSYLLRCPCTGVLVGSSIDWRVVNSKVHFHSDGHSSPTPSCSVRLDAQIDVVWYCAMHMRYIVILTRDVI